MNCINRSNAKSFRNLGICLGGAALLGGALAPALVAAPDMEQLAKENQDLKERMAKLETLAQQQGLVPNDASKKLVSAMSDISLSGFVVAFRDISWGVYQISSWRLSASLRLGRWGS